MANLKKYYTKILFPIIIFFIFSTPLHVMGYSTNEAEKNLDRAARQAFLWKGTIGGTAGNIINSILVYTGIILLILMSYSGVLWMTAGGNEEQINKAKKIIKGAIIGFVAIILSYSIVFGISTFINKIL